MDEVCSWIARALFPGVIDITVTNVETTENGMSIEARAAGDGACCPGCSQWSQRVHGSYWRHPTDLPAAGSPVRLRLRVRRFLCPNPGCGRRTFVEQVPGLTRRHSRWTERLRSVLAATGLALAGRAAARLLGDHLAIPASRSTLLRQVTALDDPAPQKVRVIGVDEFALRKGHVYGTVLVDVETRRPVDLLPDREATTVAAWLQGHPDIEVLCRDRADFYAEAADTGAPQAVQVADRWHLWHNLGQAVERCVSDHRTQLRLTSSTAQDEEPEAEPAVEPAPAPLRAIGHRCADRVREAHAAVHDLRAKGHSMKSIQRRLRMGASTVVRYAHAATPEELLRRPRQERSSRVDLFKPYLDQRWDQEGCTNAWKLFEEIKELGYPGGYSMVRAYLYPSASELDRPGRDRPGCARSPGGS